MFFWLESVKATDIDNFHFKRRGEFKYEYVYDYEGGEEDAKKDLKERGHMSIEVNFISSVIVGLVVGFITYNFGNF